MKESIIDKLKKGEIGVMPTDTIYGIVGSALNQKTVERIYLLRKRSQDKPFIILISSIEDLNKFNIRLTDKQLEFLKKVWPNQVSIILPITDQRFEYLHRGTNSLAFRFPKKEQLLKVLKEVGPMVAPSANIEGLKLAESINEAKKYFGDEVSFYEDEGIIKAQASTLIKLNEDGAYVVLREGNFRV